MEKLADGGMILRSPQPLDPHEPHTGQMLRRWAAERPDTTFLGERTDGEWRRISYAEALRSAESVAQSLLERGMRQDRPLVIVSGNSIDHALAMLGAMLAGVPVAPVSPAYSLMSQDHGKLREIFELVEPALIFAAPLAPFVPALGALDLRGCEIVGTCPMSSPSRLSPSSARRFRDPHWLARRPRSDRTPWRRSSSPPGPRVCPKA